MRENFTDALKREDGGELLEQIKERTEQIVKVLMPCPIWDMPIAAAILEKLAEVFRETARRYLGEDADEMQKGIKGLLDEIMEPQEVTMPRGLADKLREMGDEP